MIAKFAILFLCHKMDGKKDSSKTVTIISQTDCCASFKGNPLGPFPIVFNALFFLVWSTPATIYEHFMYLNDIFYGNFQIHLQERPEYRCWSTILLLFASIAFSPPAFFSFNLSVSLSLPPCRFISDSIYWALLLDLKEKKNIQIAKQ